MKRYIRQPPPNLRHRRSKALSTSPRHTALSCRPRSGLPGRALEQPVEPQFVLGPDEDHVGEAPQQMLTLASIDGVAVAAQPDAVTGDGGVGQFGSSPRQPAGQLNIGLKASRVQ